MNSYEKISIQDRQMLADSTWMDLALEQAKFAIPISRPNPPVGAAIVKDGQLLSMGFTQQPGGNHAEVEAINRAGSDVQGATIYVTLEPCSTYGRTPPCSLKIRQSGIKRVVIACQDLNPDVFGNGIRELEKSGIQVDLLPEKEAQARTLLYPFFSSLGQNGLGFPKVEYIMKAAVTMDGFMSTRNFSSQWISHPFSRLLVHRLRQASDAVLIGDGTARKDNPMLTVRIDPDEERRTLRNVFYPGGISKRDFFTRLLLTDKTLWSQWQNRPVRIILDPALNIPRDNKLVQTANEFPTWIIISKKKEKNLRAKIRRLSSYGVEIVALQAKGQGLDLQDLNRFFIEKGLQRILVEGGPRIHKSFLREGLFDRFYLFLAAKFIGGDDGLSLFSGTGVRSIENAFKIPNPRMTTIPAFHHGSDVCNERNFLLTGVENRVYGIS